MAQQKINENQTDFSELYVGGNKVATENQLPDFSQPILWTGTYYMADGQVANLSQSVLSQKNGIALLWSSYAGGTANNYSFNWSFVPKKHVELFPGGGIYMPMFNNSTGAILRKYVYVSNTTITGNTMNDDPPNNGQVLRYVIGY